jgi:CheY-like chemotaxis protein
MTGALKILVAENSSDEIFLYRRVFKNLGIDRVRYVSDGSEVIQYLKGEGKYSDRQQFPRPDWLLLDVDMGNVSGLDVLRWFQENPEYRVVPTVILSNTDYERHVQEAYKLCAHGFFVKPCGINEMADVINTIHHYWTLSQPRPTEAEMSLV